MSDITSNLASSIPQADAIAIRNNLMSQMLALAPRTLQPPSEFPKGVKDVRVPVEQTKVEPIKKPKTVKAKVVNRTEPIRKSSPSEFVSIDAIKTVDGIHIDMYDYFGFKPDFINEMQKNRLRYITGWAFKKYTDIRSALKTLNNLDNKLGNHDTGEAKLGKLYNYIKLRER